MSSLLRGAMSMFQGDGGDGTTHALVGTDIEVNNVRYRVKDVIAEGGFAIVFTAQDSRGNEVALKRQVANDRDARDAVLAEINFLHELTGHPAIIRHISTGQQKSTGGGVEFLIITELCSGGSIVDLLKKGPLKPEQVLRIFYQACRAIMHMHNREPPIIHRDMKVENLLIDSSGHVKLCDFGSATTEQHDPDESWDSRKRTLVEEETQRHTTPMYRAPEILETYSNFPIGPQLDVWALGCVLYYLCYRVHPFEDSAKLRIVNAKYTIPTISDDDYSMFTALIQSCLRVDPRERPFINDLVESVEALAVAMGTDPKGAVVSVSKRSETAPAPSQAAVPSRSEPTSEVSQNANAFFGALKSQSMSLFKEAKAKGAAMVQTAQSAYGSRGPEMFHVTSRLSAAPVQANVPEALAATAEEALATRMQQSGKPFLVVNVSQRRLRCEYRQRPIEESFCPSSSFVAPSVEQLLNLCRRITQFLAQVKPGVVVLYGEEAPCILLSACVVCFTRLVSNPIAAVELVLSRRNQAIPNLLPSFHRQLELVCKVANTSPSQIRQLVHNRRMAASSIVLQPVPLFNHLKTGCRPFVDVYSNGVKRFSSYVDYESLKSFEASKTSSIELPLQGGAPLDADVTFVISHARWVKMQGRMQAAVICSGGFHANFYDVSKQQITFNSGDLDLNKGEGDLAENFKIVLNLRADRDRGFECVDEKPAFLTHDPSNVTPRSLVESGQEYDAIEREYSFDTSSSHPSTPNRPPPPQRETSLKQHQQKKPNVPQTDFFATLNWDAAPVGADASPQTMVSNEQTTAARSATPSQQQDLFATSDTRSSNTPTPAALKKAMDAEAYERMYGIRVQADENDDESNEFAFDCDKKKETPILGGSHSPMQQPTPIQSQFDLLNLGGSSAQSSMPQPSKPQAAEDPFGDFFSAPAAATTTAAKAPSSSNDLLFDWGAPLNPTSTMHRNVSAPSFAAAQPQVNDPFAEFLSSTSAASSKPASGQNSGTATPKVARPNYSRAAFDGVSPNNGGNAAAASGKPKMANDIFGDLLSSQGFQSTTAKSGNRTLGDMRRAEEIRDMDPLAIKMRDWTVGKERNIRALLGSLNEVLWQDGVSKWKQPAMAELLQASQVKKHYFNACRIVHPDKQMGTGNEDLARAIFTELNDAYNAFEEAGAKSL